MILDKNSENPQAIVVGGGPAGLTAAIALASGGIATVLVGPRPGQADNRTTALLGGSVTALETLRVWDACADKAAPLRVMRIVDDTGRLWRAPEVKFDAAEIGQDAFGYNIENRHLVAALDARAEALPDLRRIDDQVAEVTPGDDAVTVTLKSGEALHAPLVIGADGRRSLCRAAAGITLDERQYPQAALTVSFGHSRPHRDASTEFHTPTGPFTVVPLKGQRSSLVWVLDPDEAEDIAALDDAELSVEIERASHSILGKVTVEPGRGLFPLRVGTRGRSARTVSRWWAKPRTSFRRSARRGSISAYATPPPSASSRSKRSVTVAISAPPPCSRATTACAAPTSAAERLRSTCSTARCCRTCCRRRARAGLGLYMIDRIGPLRRNVMREGVAPRANQPRLMRGEAL